MDFKDVISSRRSIRSYTSAPVSDTALANIADAVLKAPSACNRQPFRVLAVRNAEMRQRLAGCCRQDFIKDAPVIMAVAANPAESWQRGDGFVSTEVDAAIAMEHIILSATDEGLGSCWICAFDAEKAAAVLSISSPWKVIALCTLGVPAAPPAPFIRSRNGKELFEVID